MFTSLVFQDEHSGTMIERVREIDDEVSFKNKKAQALSYMSSNSSLEQIMQWHLRLGYPNFSYLRHLFPPMFKCLDFL